MADAAEGLVLPRSTTERAAALSSLVVVTRGIPEAAGTIDDDTLDQDRPAAGWVRDWTTLLDSLEDHVEILRTGVDARFTMPLTSDGYSIVGRMDLAAPEGCTVPAVLTGLDPNSPMPD